MMSKLGEIFWNGLLDPSMFYPATKPSTRIWYVDPILSDLQSISVLIAAQDHE